MERKQTKLRVRLLKQGIDKELFLTHKFLAFFQAIGLAFDVKLSFRIISGPAKAARKMARKCKETVKKRRNPVPRCVRIKLRSKALLNIIREGIPYQYN